MLSVVRAFSYFSHLANIAEDRAPATAVSACTSSRACGPASGSARASARAPEGRQGPRRAPARACFDQALIAPVLTAHPTEVQRKSILDREHGHRAPADGARPERCSRRDEMAISDRALRRAGTVAVADAHAARVKPHGRRRNRERAGVLPLHVPAEIPRLYADIEDLLDAEYAHLEPWQLPPSCGWVSWIGGDRDGNPLVNARHAALRAVKQQSRVVFELLPGAGARARRRAAALDAPRARSSPQLKDLAEASPDRSAQRHDEPYRQVLVGHLRAPRGDRAELERRGAAARLRDRRAKPYAERRRVRDGPRDHQRVARRNHGAEALRERRLRATRHAARRSASTSRTLDLRQNSDVHERVVAELFASAGVAADYLALAEAGARGLLAQELATTAPARLAVHASTPTRPRASSPSCAPRASCSAATAPQALPHYIISKTRRRRPTCSR